MRRESWTRLYRAVLDRAVAPLAKARVPAAAVASLSFALYLASGVLFALGRFTTAGVVMIPAGVCDGLAGGLARRDSRIRLFYRFVESILDRYADLALFLGVLVYYSTVNRFLDALVTGVAMAGAVMVSYAEARAASLIGGCRVGFWERPERIALMILGALVNQMPAALAILALGPNITVIHRIAFTWKQTEGRRRDAGREAKAPDESVPRSDLLERTARRGA